MTQQMQLTRRNFGKLVGGFSVMSGTGLLATVVETMMISGCGASTIATLVQTLGGAAGSLAAMLGNSALQAQITSATADAVAAVANWKTGTPAAMAIEAINVLEAAINLIPIGNPVISLLIQLVLGTADTLLGLL